MTCHSPLWLNALFERGYRVGGRENTSKRGGNRSGIKIVPTAHPEGGALINEQALNQNGDRELWLFPKEKDRNLKS